MIYMDGPKKTMLAGFFALMFVLCAFAPTAMAGSAADPEITDATGDVAISPDAALDALLSLGDYFDILSAWFDAESEDSFNVNLKCSALPDAMTAAPVTWMYDVYFSIDDIKYQVDCYADVTDASGIPTMPYWVYRLLDGNGTAIGSLNGSIDTTNGILTVTVPKESVGSPTPGSILTETYAIADGEIGIMAPLAITYSDRAPDTDYGRPYIFGGAGPNSGMISIVVTPGAITATKGQTKSTIITVKNNGTMNDTITFTGAFDGNVSNGCTASFNPTTLNVTSNGTAYAVASFIVPANATEGTITYNIQATSTGGALASGSVNLTITSGPPVTYGVDVTAPSGAEVKPGETHAYSFTVRNTGTADSDQYDISATSENSWDVEVAGDSTITVAKGASKTVQVNITVPSGTADGATDVLTLKAISKGNTSKSDQATVTTTATTSAGGAGSVLDQANEFADGLIGSYLESAGIEGALGEYTPLIILGVLALLLLIILIIIIAALSGGKKFRMDCDDNAHDVKRGYDTQYQITLTAKKGGRNGIPIVLEAKGIPEGWSATLDKTAVSPKKNEPAGVILTVKPPAEAAEGAVAEISVIARMEKKKKKKRSIATRSKVVIPVSQIQISNVTNIPQEAKKGDRVLTVVEIENRDDTAANGLKCSIYVNEKAIHSEIISLGANSKTEVKKSWIAESDENTVRVALE